MLFFNLTSTAQPLCTAYFTRLELHFIQCVIIETALLLRIQKSMAKLRSSHGAFVF